MDSEVMASPQGSKIVIGDSLWQSVRHRNEKKEFS
jgi:hypothetical protein